MSIPPLVSVLMPVYNGEKFLRPAIESILSQSFTDYEFIIINDGSSDTSEQIILSYTDARIKYVRNEKNLKLIATLNKGIDLCKGKYIARMDADDVAYPERFAKQVSFMESNPEYGLCGTDIEIDGAMNSWVQMGDMNYLRFCFLFHNPFCHPTTFIRNSIVKEHKLYYPAEYIHAEEYVFWLRIIEHSKCINLDEKLLNYRLHQGQVTTVFKPEQRRIGELIRLEIFSEIVLFTTAGMRKTHLVIAEMVTQALMKESFEKFIFNFGGWVTIFQLQQWLFMVRISLPFKKKWDSIYLRKLVAMVSEGLEVKKQQEGAFITRMLNRVKRKTNSLSNK